MGVLVGDLGPTAFPTERENAALTAEQLEQIYQFLTGRGISPLRKPITEYGNPKFTAGKPIGVHTDGYIARSLIQKSDLTSILAGTYSPTAHGHPFTDITGVATDAQIPAAIARDAEVAAAYSPLGHTHTGVYAPVAHTHPMTDITTYVPSTAWTPELRFAGVAPVGITYGSRSGKYIRIGDFVQVNFDFTLTNKGAQAGAAVLYGLPLTIGTLVGGISSIFWQGMTTAYINITLAGAPGTATAGFWGTVAAAAAQTQVLNTALSNTTRFLGTLSYIL